MQHHYRYYQGLRKRQKARPLWLGTMVHELIEARHEHGSYDQALLAMTQEFNGLFLEEKAELGDLPTIAKQIVDSYLKFYESDGLHYPKGRRGKRTEIALKIDLDNHTRFIGFIDALPEDDRNRLWLMDHKTCASIPDEDARFADLQLLMYLWLLPLMGYRKPDGVIWDYLRTKLPTVPETLKSGQLSKAKSIDTTYEVYMGEVERVLGPEAKADYLEFAETLRGREDKFYRRIYLPSPNQAMIDSVVKDFMDTAQEIRIKGPTSTVRSMNKDCKQCGFYNLCSAEVRGLDDEYIRTTEFTTREQRNAEEKISSKKGRK